MMGKMKITKIEKQKNNAGRYNIYADDVFYTGLSEEEILRLHLKEGDTVEASLLLSGVREDKFLRALNKGGEYIGGGRKTQKQVEDYLVKKGYDDDIVCRVIVRLKEYRYIDDAEYARAYIQQNAVKGNRAIKYSLMHKGVDSEIIECALSERNAQDEMDGALRAGTAYLKGKRFKDARDARLKLYQALARRGFDYDIVSEAVQSLLQGEESDF